MGLRPKQTFLQRRNSDGWQRHEKMLNITHLQRNANQKNRTEIPSHAGQNGCYQKVYKQQMLKRVKRKGNPLLHCWCECKLVQPLWKTVWRFLKKLEIEVPYDPAIQLLGIHTKETRSDRDMCTPMFIAALYIIARTWKQPRCPSAEDKEAVVHIHHGILLSH